MLLQLFPKYVCGGLPHHPAQDKPGIKMPPQMANKFMKIIQHHWSLDKYKLK